MITIEILYWDGEKRLVTLNSYAELALFCKSFKYFEDEMLSYRIVAINGESED